MVFSIWWFCYLCRISTDSGSFVSQVPESTALCTTTYMRMNLEKVAVNESYIRWSHPHTVIWLRAKWMRSTMFRISFFSFMLKLLFLFMNFGIRSIFQLGTQFCPLDGILKYHRVFNNTKRNVSINNALHCIAR